MSTQTTAAADSDCQRPASCLLPPASAIGGLFDSHAHLDDQRFDNDRHEIIGNCVRQGMRGIINVGADMQSSLESIALAQRHDIVWAAVGIHPHSAAQATAEDYARLRSWAQSEARVVAIGEIGLDYHYDFSPRDVQKKVFEQQLQLAMAVEKPVIIHNRESHADMLEILESCDGKVRGVFHCFSGSVEMLKLVLKMGLHISVGGPVTFKNARKLAEVVRYVPTERLLLETDCPYLTPEPCRGKRNEPLLAGYAAACVAGIKGITVEETVRLCAENTVRLFGIPGQETRS